MKYKLSELMDIIGGGTPKTTKEEYWNGTIPWLSVKDFNNDQRYVYTTEKNITELGLTNSSTKLLNKDDIIISARGTVGELAMIPFPMAFNQSCYGLKAKKSVVDSAFLYYVLKYHIKSLKKNTHGSVFDTITRDTFSGIEVDIPILKHQKRIAEILGALDDKIELNNKINENLEQQAMAVFKSWFVDFTLNGGTAPKEWCKVTLDNITSLVTRGIAPKYSDNSDQTVINQKCIRNHMIDLSLARTHTPKVINEKWLHFGDLLVNSTGEGTLGRAAQVWFEPHNLTVDSHVTIVRPKSSQLIFYVGLWAITHEREIEALHTGSTGQTELPKDRLKAMELLMPDIDTLCKFNSLIRPVAEEISSNQIANKRLSMIRDTLMPPLMSGKFDVSKINL